MAMLLLAAGVLFSQNTGVGEPPQRGTIPEELLRPRREESPRYPIDMVIGPLGQGRAPSEAYNIARRAAEALLAGTIDARVLSTVNRVFLESYMGALNEINPRLVRLGGGREEPDGSVSFLVRFAGREQGITGELFVRLEERRPAGRPAASPPAAEAEGEPETEESARIANIPVERVWVFEDVILEEARSREEENRESRNRFDFSPYERFF